MEEKSDIENLVEIYFELNRLEIFDIKNGVIFDTDDWV